MSVHTIAQTIEFFSRHCIFPHLFSIIFLINNLFADNHIFIALSSFFYILILFVYIKYQCFVNYVYYIVNLKTFWGMSRPIIRTS